MAPRLRVTEHVHAPNPEVGDTYIVVAVDASNRAFDLEPWTPPEPEAPTPVVRRVRRASNGE